MTLAVYLNAQYALVVLSRLTPPIGIKRDRDRIGMPHRVRGRTQSDGDRP